MSSTIHCSVIFVQKLLGIQIRETMGNYLLEVLKISDLKIQMRQSVILKLIHQLT